MFQVSYSSYSDHKSKPPDLFKKDENNVSMYDKILQMMKRPPHPTANDQAGDQSFSKLEFYIYLQPTNANMLQRLNSYCPLPTFKRKRNPTFTPSSSNSSAAGNISLNDDQEALLDHTSSSATSSSGTPSRTSTRKAAAKAKAAIAASSSTSTTKSLSKYIYCTIFYLIISF